MKNQGCGCGAHTFHFIFTLWLVSLWGFSTWAVERGVRGRVTLEGEFYQDDGELYTYTIEETTGVFVEFEAYVQTERTLAQLGFIARDNQEDDSLDFFFSQDTYFSVALDAASTWRGTLGYKVLNWSVLEAFHPTGGLNSPNYGSPPEDWERRGEPVLELSKDFDSSVLSLYFFPRFEQPVVPSGRSRKSLMQNSSRIEWGPSVQVVDGHVVRDNEVSQWGMKWTTSLEGTDMSTYLLRHVDRRAPLLGTHQYRFIGEGENRLVFPEEPRTFVFSPTPYYFMAWELGALVEASYGNCILKFEGATLKYDPHDLILTGYGLLKKKDYTDVALGLEIPLSLFSGQETTFYLEAEGIFGVPKEERALIGAFQRDLLLGFNHAWNDALGRALRFIFITDMEWRSESFYLLSYQQRWNENFSLTLGFRKYEAPEKENASFVGTGLETYHEDNSLFVDLSWHF